MADLLLHVTENKGTMQMHVVARMYERTFRMNEVLSRHRIQGREISPHLARFL